MSDTAPETATGESEEDYDLRAEQTPAKYILFGVVTVVFTAIDQWTKILVQRNIGPLSEEIQVIDGFLSFVHAENPGAAFGMFGDSAYRMYFFGAFTILALGVLARMLYELPRDDRFQNVALGLISSGAIGNAIDRARFGAVVDFIDVSRLYFPWVFNIADSGITIGVVLLLLDSLRRETKGVGA